MARLLTAKVLGLVLLLAGCTSAPYSEYVTSGAEQRDEHGVAFVEHHIAGLRVLETVTGGASFDARLPVVLSIHGRGDRARLPTTTFAGLERPVRLLVPEASDPLGDGFTWSPVSVTERRPHTLAVALRDNADRLAAVLRWAIANRPMQGRPIVTGFSQGGMLSFTLAVRHPSLVSAAVPVSGFIPRELLPRHMPARVELPPIEAVHGAADRVVRIGPTRRNVRRLRALGFHVALLEIPEARHVYDDAIAAEVHTRLTAAVVATDPTSEVDAAPHP